MTLSLHQKSLYLMIYNATMISRSVGRADKNVRDFKISVFEELEKLTDKMDAGTLVEKNIIRSIDELRNEFEISFGQAQKPINVILKYHFYLTKSDESTIKDVLHCPIDSVILEELDRKKKSLSDIDKEEYLKIQKDIGDRGKTRIGFDTKWDEQNLREEGLL